MKKYLVIGFILGALTFGSAAALASITSQLAYVTFSDIKVFVDGVKVTSDVEPFTYNGRVMLPVRAVAEAFKKPVEWDEKQKAVYIGQRYPSPLTYEFLVQKPIARVDKINKTGTASFYAGSPLEGNLILPGGRVVDRGFCVLGGHADSMAIHFDVGRRAVILESLIGLDVKASNSGGRAYFRVLGDGKELFRSNTFTWYTEPQKISVPIEGVRELTLEAYIENQKTAAVFANPTINLIQ